MYIYKDVQRDRINCRYELHVETDSRFSMIWSKNKNIWSDGISILQYQYSRKENFEQQVSILEVIIRNWSSFDPSFHRFSPTLERSGHREDENKNKKKLSKGTIQEELLGVIVEGVVFLCIFFFFFFFPCLTQKVASPFEAVECGPRWRCCRIDLVPTFALRGRRGTVFAGARVMSTSS